MTWNDYLLSNIMKDGILFYFGICVVALILKYIIGKLSTYFGKNRKDIDHQHHSLKEHSHAYNHEEEHFIAHLIKYLLLILFAILAYKLINGGFHQNFS